MICDRNGYYDVPDGKIASVVTYLEMTEPPPGAAPPERDDLTLRPVGEADLAWYRTLYRGIGERWLWFSRLDLGDAELREILHDPAVEVFAPTRDGRDIGLLELDRRDPENVELAFFGIAPDQIGQGAGHWLMAMAIALVFGAGAEGAGDLISRASGAGAEGARDLVSRASGAGPRRFWLHTCSLDHPAALSFYRRAGFTPYKRAVEIADDPRLRGILPKDTGPGVPLIEGDSRRGDPDRPRPASPSPRRLARRSRDRSGSPGSR